MLTNNDETIDIVNVNPPIGKSDHGVLCFHVNLGEVAEKNITTYTYYKGDYGAIKEDIKKVNWEAELTYLNIEESWKLFECTVKQSVEKHIPKAKIGQSAQPSWMTLTTRKHVKDKHKAWNKYQKNSTADNWSMYKKARNAATEEVKRSKQDFERQIAREIKENPKSFWSYVKKGTASHSQIPPLLNKMDHLLIIQRIKQKH